MFKENLEKAKQLPLDIWIYDVEVFKQYWCVTFFNVKTAETIVVEQNYMELKNILLKRLKNAFVGGYNNIRYDDYILKELLNNKNPFELSNKIINENLKPWTIERIKRTKLPFFTFDIMDLVGVGRMSLKKYEAFLGLVIQESDVPFDFENELDEKQKNSVKQYNLHDVKASAFLFIKFIDQFIIKLKLISDYNLNSFNLSKSGSQLTAIIFKARKELLPFYKEYNYEVPENIKEFYREYAKEFYWLIEKLEAQKFYTEFSENYSKEQINLSFNFGGLDYEFKSGGLHAAKKITIEEKANIINKDIISNYPHLIKLYKYGSRRAPDMETKIGELLEARKKAKREKDRIKSDAIKELIVRPFGAMEYKFNDLWDAKMRMSICLTGELIIFILSYIIAPYVELLQVNTDGIMFRLLKPEYEQEVEKLCSLWEQRTLMTLETEKYERLWQKDVNNYVVTKGDNIKAKGGMVKYFDKQFNNEDYNIVRGTANNNLSALDSAVVNYFVYNKPVMETLKEIKELIRFQFVFEVKGNFSDTFYGEKLLPRRKVWRIFYTKQGEPVFKAYKVGENWKKDKVPNSSEKNTIINIDIRNKTTDFLDLDYEYYEQLALARIEQYLNNEISNKKEKFNILYPGESYECAFCGASLMNEKVVRYALEMEVCKKCYFKEKE
ncbi:hypothetical protein [Mesomycoplasma molare]|uniref:DNA-directed DNA polymerase n=1 Tax=Mesomycoplasma molare TaxID=171288 RepID=A0ABY5TWY6_9BACT|nr:hypothetical protein [Mesomycoplasma molare]UWD34041.1 hypothetical protein NX772_02960 [Mesomycoplasma molare]